MSRVAMLVAGRFETRTGGSIYNRRMAEALRARGWRVDVHELDASFPYPTCAAIAHARDVFRRLEPGGTVLVDGLAYGAMPAVVLDASRAARLVPIVHLPLAAAAGLTPEEQERFTTSERAALTAASLVVVTGAGTPSLMAHYGLTHPRVVVVEPGTAPAPIAAGSGNGKLQVLTVATINAGKGHEMLLESLAELRDRPWHLTCAGSTSRCPVTVRRVRDAILRCGLEDRVVLTGDLDEAQLAAQYERADFVVLNSLRETFGMAVAEALARGIPVIGTATGSIPALVGDDAGMVIPPGDAASLTQALARMFDDEAFRRLCAAGARRVRSRLASWDDAAGRLAHGIETIDAHG